MRKTLNESQLRSYIKKLVMEEFLKDAEPEDEMAPLKDNTEEHYDEDNDLKFVKHFDKLLVDGKITKDKLKDKILEYYNLFTIDNLGMVARKHATSDFFRICREALFDMKRNNK